MMITTQRLQLASPEQRDVSIMRDDMVHDHRRLYATFVTAEPAEWLDLELMSGDASPATIVVETVWARITGHAGTRKFGRTYTTKVIDVNGTFASTSRSVLIGQIKRSFAKAWRMSMLSRPSSLTRAWYMSFLMRGNTSLALTPCTLSPYKIA